jgi:perosamine synthetase
MSDQFIPVNTPDLSGNEKQYLLSCIESGWISSDGPYVSEFESKFSARVGRKFGVAVSNGTVALEVAVRALNLPKGSEVILPTFTIISCAGAIVKAGLVPVLVDCDPISWNIVAEKIEERITKNTRAIMVVHIYGLPCDMDIISGLAKKYNLRVIEDAAEMHGQTYKGQPCGSFGDISCFSFYANKHVTTGEGGMIVTNDEILADRCKSFRNLCFLPERRFYHEELGDNYRLTNLQAALGLGQLERLDQIVEKKRKMGAFYLQLLSGMDEITQPIPENDYASNIYWVYGLVLADHIPYDASEIIARMAKLQVGTRPFFWCMHEQPVFRNMGLFMNESYPNAEKISRRGFYLPSGLALTNEEQITVVDKLRIALQMHK